MALLARLIEKPFFQWIGLLFFLIGICAFFYQTHSQSIYQDPKPASTGFSHSAPTSTVIPLTGIEVLNEDNSVNAGASQQLTDIIDKSNQSVMQGRLLVAPPVVVDSTTTTKIVGYKVSLTLKTYERDGLHCCNTRLFETNIFGDDNTPVDKIKQQAMAIFRREMAKIPTGITCP
jgi:hypothetical protein